MKFRAGDLEFNATIADASEAPSPQTGNVVRTLTIQFRAQKAGMHERALNQAQVRQAGGLFSLDDTDQPVLEWRVREFTSSYIGSEPWGVNHHVWRIEQVERLACERLIIGTIELEPYEYVEEVIDDGIVRLAARALTSEADLAALAALNGLAQVTRVGISDSARSMGFDYVWGERPEGPAVVVCCQDVAEPRVTLGGPVRPPAFDETGGLIERLRTRGAITEEDVQALAWARHAARRVANVDAWSL